MCILNISTPKTMATKQLQCLLSIFACFAAVCVRIYVDQFLLDISRLNPNLLFVVCPTIDCLLLISKMYNFCFIVLVLGTWNKHRRTGQKLNRISVLIDLFSPIDTSRKMFSLALR